MRRGCRREVCVRGSGFWKSVHEYIAAVSQYTKRINLHRRPLTRSRYNSLSFTAWVGSRACASLSLSYPLSHTPSHSLRLPAKGLLTTTTRRREWPTDIPVYIHRSSCIYGCRDRSFVKYKIIITSSYIGIVVKFNFKTLKSNIVEATYILIILLCTIYNIIINKLRDTYTYIGIWSVQHFN